jgi:hypothetical protein
MPPPGPGRRPTECRIDATRGARLLTRGCIARSRQGATSRGVSCVCPSWWLAVVTLLVLLIPVEARAQETEEENGCVVLCTPELEFEPTLTVENLFAPPRVEDISSGAVSRLERELAFEMVLGVSVPTELPYVGLTFEAIFTPFVDNNGLELESELNLVFLREEWTEGWLEGHFSIVDEFSPAEGPGRNAAYTHKLNFELDLALSAFNWLPPERWLRNVGVEASFDYLATGLPRRGDIVGGQRFLDDASAWSLSFVLVVPVAPLNR